MRVVGRQSYHRPWEAQLQRPSTAIMMAMLYLKLVSPQRPSVTWLRRRLLHCRLWLSVMP